MEPHYKGEIQTSKLYHPAARRLDGADCAVLYAGELCVGKRFYSAENTASTQGEQRIKRKHPSPEGGWTGSKADTSHLASHQMVKLFT